MGIESIALTCDKSVYYAGEVINGFCNVMVVSSSVEVGVIPICFEGEVSVYWTESRTESYTDSNGESQTRTVTESYSAHEDIVKIPCDLSFGCDSLPPGTNSVPFSIPTPPSLISTFEGFHGWVRYNLKAKKPRDCFLGSWFPHKAKTYVCILQVIDTNIPTYNFPVIGTDTKTICCLCCASGPLTIEAKCDRAAYSPGDIATVSARFDNKSSREVRPYARLIQNQSYYAQGSTNSGTKKYDLAPINDPTGGSMLNLAECSSKDWDKLQFRIPPCYPSNKCNILEVSYYLEICLDIPHAFDLKVSLPIVVGTIPYRAGHQVIVTTEQALPGWPGIGGGSRLENVTAPPITSSSGNAIPLDAPPPSYFETVFQTDASIAKAADEKAKKDKEKNSNKEEK